MCTERRRGGLGPGGGGQGNAQPPSPQHLHVCHVDDCQLVQKRRPVRSMHVHLHKKIVYGLDEVSYALLHLQAPLIMIWEKEL